MTERMADLEHHYPGLPKIIDGCYVWLVTYCNVVEGNLYPCGVYDINDCFQPIQMFLVGILSNFTLFLRRYKC